MGRGRKKQYIKVLTSKDKEMLRAFRNCGRLSSDHLKIDLSMSDKRVINFQRDGYVEKTRLLNRKTKKMDAVYQLTEKGRTAVESYLNLTHCYKSNSGLHDLGVADQYLSLTKDQRDSWETESELQELREAMVEEGLLSVAEDNRASATDGAYINEFGTKIAFEVITRNYGKVEIEAKETFAAAMGMQLEMTRI